MTAKLIEPVRWNRTEPISGPRMPVDFEGADSLAAGTKMAGPQWRVRTGVTGFRPGTASTVNAG